MVPPLVMINAKYYGWRVALYIAAIMFVSIVLTALLMHVAFTGLGIVPESGRAVGEVTRFAFDYTFYLNIVFAAVAATMVWLHRRHVAAEGAMQHDMAGDSKLKRIAAVAAIVVLVVGPVGRMAFSTKLVESSTCPCSRNRSSSGRAAATATSIVRSAGNASIRQSL